MQRNIVEDGVDAIGLEFAQHLVAVRPFREQDVIEMTVVLTVGGHHRAAKQALLLQRGQHAVITLPDRPPLAGDAFGLLELGPEIGGGDFARQERRTEILPSIFVDLAAKEPAAVSALFAQDFGAKGQSAIVDQQAAAFARR
jgi:hypothetical protein